MDGLTRIGLAAGRVLAFLMRVVGLASAVDLLLIHPQHASAPEVFLSGVLVMGGQATKDLLVALVDRILAPPHHAAEEREEREAREMSEAEKAERQRGRWR